MGVFFIGFVSQYGYDRVLSVLGRHMRDFLNGLDNLHEYLKFSYPRMRAPSFICENETKQGLTLHYRSKRRGFVYYTMGQIREVREFSTLFQLFIFVELFRLYYWSLLNSPNNNQKGSSPASVVVLFLRYFHFALFCVCI